MGPNVLSHPAQMKANDHKRILNELRTVMQHTKETKKLSVDLSSIDLRDWWFVVEGGTPIVRLFLGRRAGEALTVDDCMVFHEAFMESTVFDNFGDNVAIEVGSLGAEPPLREVEDFKEVVGSRIDLETWSKLNGRGRFPMVLSNVEEGDADATLVLVEGKQEFRVPIAEVRTAFLPYSPAVKGPKKQSKKR